MNPRLVLACGIALALLCGSLLASPQEIGPTPVGTPRDDTDRWRFELVPYVWLARLDGSIGLDPLPAVRISAEVPEPIVDLDFALAESCTARKGRWAVFSDITFTKLGVDETVSASQIEIDSALVWASLAGGYAVLDAPRARVELLAGARYTYLNNDGESDGGVTASSSANEDWLDPLVGFNARAELASRLSVGMLANVGGFGVGSDLSYELLPRVSYAFNDIINLHAGYRLLSLDFDSSAVEYDVREYGWIFGVGFNF